MWLSVCVSVCAILRVCLRARKKQTDGQTNRVNEEKGDVETHSDAVGETQRQATNSRERERPTKEKEMESQTNRRNTQTDGDGQTSRQTETDRNRDREAAAHYIGIVA